MATQLKPDAFANTTSLTLRPNIRVAFSAGEAALAIREKIAATPDADRTLEEIAAGRISPALKALLDTAEATKVAHETHYRQIVSPAEERCYAMKRDTVEQQARADIESGLAVAEAPTSDLLDLDIVAEKAVASFQVTTAADLHAKLTFMNERHMCSGNDWSAQLCADTGRVAQVANSPAAAAPVSAAMAALIGAEAARAADYNAYLDSTYRPAEAASEAAKGSDGEAAAKQHYDETGQHLDRLAEGWADAQSEIAAQPVSTAADLRTKLAFMLKNQMGEGMDWTAELLADAERITAGVQMGTSALRTLLDDRNEAVALLNNEHHWSKAEEADLCRRINVSERTILTSPAVTADDAVVKLITLAQVSADGADPDPGAIRRAIADAGRFLGAGYTYQPAAADRAILDAFGDRCRDFAATYHTDMTREEEDEYYKRLDAYEGVLADTPATTIAAAIAKLRIAFMHQNGSAWADRAILDPTHPEFVAGLAASDMYTRMKWSAIEDLARIGGVNLAEQGR